MNKHQRLHEIKFHQSREKIGGINCEGALHAITALEMQVLAIDGGCGLIAEFVPIRLVTIIEVYVRERIGVLLYSNDTHKERAQALVKSVKFDYLLARALENQELSLSEIVAHEVSINSIGAITRIFETLLETNFWEELANARLHVAEETGHIVAQPITDLPCLQTDLAKLFEVRHILTHELPVVRVITRGDLESFVRSSRQFILALGQMLIENAWWKAPATVQDVELQMRAYLIEAENDLERADQDLLHVDEDRRDEILRAQEAWRKFAVAHAELVASRDVELTTEIARLGDLTKATEFRRSELAALTQEWRSTAVQARD